jgi:hypothetical protein
LYTQHGSDQFPPVGNCIGYFPNEWMTFTIKVQLGQRVNDEWVNSVITLWVGREGQPSEKVIERTYNLTAGAPAENQKFGKIWLLPYITGKDSTISHPAATTWYDELIISTSTIPDP